MWIMSAVKFLVVSGIQASSMVIKHIIIEFSSKLSAYLLD